MSVINELIYITKAEKLPDRNDVGVGVFVNVLLRREQAQWLYLP